MSLATGVILFAAIIAVTIVVGMWVGRFVKSSDDFLVGGRRIGGSLVAASILASWVNSYTVFVNSQFAYTLPIPNYLILLVGALMLPVLVAIPVALKARQVLPTGYTIAELLGKRFDPAMHMYATLVQLGNHLILLFTQIMIGSLFISTATRVPAWIFMAIFSVAMMIYIGRSGIWGSVTTDYMQIGAAIIGIAILVPVFYRYAGGPGAIFQGILAAKPDMLHFNPEGFATLFVSVAITIAGGVLVPQYVWQRVFSCRDDNGVTRSMLLLCFAYPGMAFIGAVPSWIALAKGMTLPGPDQAPMALLAYLAPWASILFSAIILLYVFSTADSALTALTETTTVDIYRKYVTKGNKDEKKEGSLNLWATILFCAVSFFLALKQVTMVQAFFLIGLMQMTLIGPIVFAVYSKRVVKNQAAAGAIAGIVIGATLFFTKGEFYGNIAGLIVPFVVGYGLSLVAPGDFKWETRPEERVEAGMS